MRTATALSFPPPATPEPCPSCGADAVAPCGCCVSAESISIGACDCCGEHGPRAVHASDALHARRRCPTCLSAYERSVADRTRATLAIDRVGELARRAYGPEASVVLVLSGDEDCRRYDLLLQVGPSTLCLAADVLTIAQACAEAERELTRTATGRAAEPQRRAVQAVAQEMDADARVALEALDAGWIAATLGIEAPGETPWAALATLLTELLAEHESRETAFRAAIHHAQRICASAGGLS